MSGHLRINRGDVKGQKKLIDSIVKRQMCGLSKKASPMMSMIMNQKHSAVNQA